MATWDAVAVKAQLRLTAQKLGQLQERKDSQGQTIRKDIANHLQQGNVGLARAKAQNLIHEESIADLLEALEMHVGLIVEHFAEIEQNETPSPTIAEAASSIIFAAPHIESRDLNVVRELLMQRLGPDFSRSAISNYDNRVSQRAVRALSAPPPSATNLNDYMSAIAKSHGVEWTPEPRRHDILNALSEILDPTISPVVDLPLLQRLCYHGIPDDPPWIRPRVWKLFFGVLPILKSSWDIDIHRQRESYYHLVRRLLSPFSSLPPPTDPLVSSDLTLLDVSTSLARVPHSLFSGLQDEPETSPLSLLDAAAADDIRIDCASNLDLRLQMIHDSQNSRDSMRAMTPEIRLEPNASPVTETFAGRRPGAPTTLLCANDYNVSGAHQKHMSALLRLLYLHSCLNPMNRSPHIPSLLIPLYSVLIQETEPKDAAHVEADTFWVFEAMIGEFSELEDEEGSNIWMKKLSERLAWADEELSTNLHAKGLDPALPHYSYRWLAPLLTQTLPLSSVYLVWDALFSRPMRERDTNAKLEHLLNICSSMLTRARAPLFRLGKAGRRSPGLWGEEHASRPPPSPLRPWELSDAFLEGMSLLQLYPVEAAGGIDMILQSAFDMAQRREEEMKAPKAGNLGLGARLKVTMWKGFTNQLSPTPGDGEVDEVSEDEDLYDDGNETETPQDTSSPGITSRLANTVWRGITNQSSMEVPLSPLTPLTPPPLSHSSPSSSSTSPPIDNSPQSTPSPTSSGPNIWGYAEKLKDSDAAASLAKVSSNWRAKAMDAWSARKKTGGNTDIVSPTSTTSELPPSPATWNSWMRSPTIESESRRRESLPEMDRSNVYSPPPRPAFFHPPRDSFMPIVRGTKTSSRASGDMSPQSDSGLVHRTKASLASMASISPVLAPAPPPKQGPRPLRLSSSHLMTASKSTHSSRSTTPTHDHGQWSEVMRTKGHAMHKDSHSSVSSLSPSDALGRSIWKGSRSDVGYDAGRTSRLVPINRRSISPMAPGYRMPQDRPPSIGSSSDSAMRPSPGATSESHSEKGWGRVDVPDSPRFSTSPIPHTPLTDTSPESSDVRLPSGEHQRSESVVLSDPNVTPLEAPQPRKLTRKKTPLRHPAAQTEQASDPSIPPMPSLNSRIRSKRYPNRPSNLRAKSRSSTLSDKTPSPNSLAPDGLDEHEVAVLTPRASTFDTSESSSASPTSPQLLRRSGKGLTDGHEARVRKISVERPRVRKISMENRDGKGKRESAANEGDDEGYGDLLSAYESED